MPAVTKWLQGISLDDELTPQQSEPPENDERARWLSDTVLGKKRKAHHVDDTFEDPFLSTKFIEQVCSDDEDEATVYYTSHNGNIDTQDEDEGTPDLTDLILTPEERKALLDIQDTEWEELFQDITAATALPLRRRLRPGEHNAPLVPSPLSMDADCADEIVNSVLPTYAKGVWPSYRRKMRLAEEELDR